MSSRLLHTLAFCPCAHPSLTKTCDGPDVWQVTGLGKRGRQPLPITCSHHLVCKGHCPAMNALGKGLHQGVGSFPPCSLQPPPSLVELWAPNMSSKNMHGVNVGHQCPGLGMCGPGLRGGDARQLLPTGEPAESPAWGITHLDHGPCQGQWKRTPGEVSPYEARTMWLSPQPSLCKKQCLQSLTTWTAVEGGSLSAKPSIRP